MLDAVKAAIFGLTTIFIEKIKVETQRDPNASQHVYHKLKSVVNSITLHYITLH